MKNNVLCVMIISAIITYIMLLVLFFVGKILSMPMFVAANSLGLCILTWYLIKRLKTSNLSVVWIIIGILIARYIAILDWFIFGFKERIALVPLELFDLVAVLLGLLCYFKQKAWIWITSIAGLLACHVIYQYWYLP